MGFLEPLAELGVMGLFAGFMGWLYLHERKISRQATLIYQKFLQGEAKRREAEIKVRFGYTRAIENLNQTVMALGEESSSRKDTCQMHSRRLIDEIEKFLEESKLKRAHEEGREAGVRESTGQTRLPPGGSK